MFITENLQPYSGLRPSPFIPNEISHYFLLNQLIKSSVATTQQKTVNLSLKARRQKRNEFSFSHISTIMTQKLDFGSLVSLWPMNQFPFYNTTMRHAVCARHTTCLAHEGNIARAHRWFLTKYDFMKARWLGTLKHGV